MKSKKVILLVVGNLLIFAFICLLKNDVIKLGEVQTGKRSTGEIEITVTSEGGPVLITEAEFEALKKSDEAAEAVIERIKKRVQNQELEPIAKPPVDSVREINDNL